MKILLITVCYNEEDLAKHFLNHYTPFCDKIIVYDNLSTDNTKNILSKEKKVEIIKFGTNNLFDDRKHSDIKNNVWKKYKDQYDWVICCDFDEFLYHPNLITMLEKFKEEGVSVPSIIGFNMKSFNFPKNYENQIIDQVQYGKYDKFFSKNIIFDPKLISEIDYELGCHHCNPTGIISYSSEPLFVLHYKKLGIAYETKKINGYKRKTLIQTKDAKPSEAYTHILNSLSKRYDSENKLEKENINVIKSINDDMFKSKVRNLIITIWTNYDSKIVFPFLSSLKRNIVDKDIYTDIVIFYKDIDQSQLMNIRNQFSGRIRFIEITKEYNCHINTYRHELYYKYLESIGNRYDYVLLTDIRDIVFQSENIFKYVEKDKTIVYSEEKPLVENPEVRNWERACYNIFFDFNSEEFSKLINSEYYCAGVVLGSSEKIKHLCKSIFMFCLLKSSCDKKIDTNFSTETAAFNYLISVKELDYIVKRTGAFQVLSFVRLKERDYFKVNDDGEVINNENIPYSILHFNGMTDIHPFFKNYYFYKPEELIIEVEPEKMVKALKKKPIENKIKITSSRMKNNRAVKRIFQTGIYKFS